MKDHDNTTRTPRLDAEHDPRMIEQAQLLALRTRILCQDLPFDDDPASFLNALEDLAKAEDSSRE